MNGGLCEGDHCQCPKGYTGSFCGQREYVRGLTVHCESDRMTSLLASFCPLNAGDWLVLVFCKFCYSCSQVSSLSASHIQCFTISVLCQNHRQHIYLLYWHTELFCLYAVKSCRRSAVHKPCRRFSAGMRANNSPALWWGVISTDRWRWSGFSRDAAAVNHPEKQSFLSEFKAFLIDIWGQAKAIGSAHVKSLWFWF